MVLRNMAQERSKPLHNFVLPSLKWGNQRHLRCMKLDSNGDLDRRRPSGSNDDDDAYLYLRKREKFEKSPPPPESSRSKKRKRDDPYDGIESLRAKLLLDLRVAAENMKFPTGDEKEEDESASGDAAARPCNLRTRRAAACRATPVEIAKLDDDDRQERREQGRGQSQLKGLGEIMAAAAAAVGRDVEKERRKFSISLARDEIKDDLLMMTGKKPARRPKKRAKIIQNQLDNLFPGFWLTEVTTESYRVPDEAVEAKKGKRSST